MKLFRNDWVVAWLAVFCLAALITGIHGCTNAGAQAAGDTITWTNPTAHTDGTALTDLTSIVISWGAKGGPYSAGSTTVPESAAAPITSVVVPRAAGPGTVCYVGVAVDSAGLQSAPSNEACKTVRANPNPPGSLTVK